MEQYLQEYARWQKQELPEDRKFDTSVLKKSL